MSVNSKITAVEALKKLEDLNKDFLTQHSATSVLALNNIDSVMVYNDGKLGLWKKINNVFQETSQKSSAAKDTYYNVLKHVSHVSVSITVLVQAGINDKSCYSKIINHMQKILEDIILIQTVTKEIFSDDDLKMQEIILQESERVLRLLIYNNCNNAEHLLKTYLEKINAALEYNSKSAAEIQLKSLRDIVENWKLKHITDLSRNRILIVGVHGPRKDLIESQYFESLYTNDRNNSVEDDKIFYVEMLPSQLSKIDIKKDLIEGFLASCELNKSIGEHILGDRKAMFKDVLHKYAPEIIKSMNEKPKCPFMHG